MTEFELRCIRPDEHEAFVRTMEPTFGRPVDDGMLGFMSATVELERAVAVFDGAQMVGTGEVWSLQLTVPGGQVRMAGLTSERVLPSHRRRGVLTRLVGHQLADACRRGEPLVGLWASEATIYGRFGFAPATIAACVEIDGSRARFGHEVDPRGRVRLLNDREALDVLPPVYDAVLATTPGMFSRSLDRWRGWLRWDLDEGRGDVGPRQHAAFGRRGYVSYRIERRRASGSARNRVLVGELMATDDEAYVGLWTWCRDLDLTVAVHAGRRPVDEPARHLLTDFRAMQVTTSDGLWLRILDVPAALAARRYAADGVLVFSVLDKDGYAEGCYRLEVRDGRGSCEPTSAAAQVVLPVAALSGAYLGGTGLPTLQRAGLVHEAEPGAVVRFDRMLRADRPPWCPWSF